MDNYDFSSFQILVNDYKKIFEFIHPDSRNNSAYSYRVFELFCRVCIDFDLICRNKYQAKNEKISSKKTKDLKMNDFKSFFSTHLEQDILSTEVGLIFWKPSIIYIKPLNDWSLGEDLTWYDDYNTSKHNVGKNFKLANMKNLTLAIAGLYLLLQNIYGTHFFQPYSTIISSGGTGDNDFNIKKIDGQIFHTRTRNSK